MARGDGDATTPAANSRPSGFIIAFIQFILFFIGQDNLKKILAAHALAAAQGIAIPILLPYALILFIINR